MTWAGAGRVPEIKTREACVCTRLKVALPAYTTPVAVAECACISITEHRIASPPLFIMAPVDSVAATGSNSLPIAIFGGQILLVSGLTAHILYTTRRAAKSLPPSTRTRSQDPVRRRHAITFSILALLSFVSVTTFAVTWRAHSYVKWAKHNNHEAPGSVWGGWYGTGESDRWNLGDWITDIDLLREADAVGVMNPDGFLYTSQYFVGLLASSIFMGVEGTSRFQRLFPCSSVRASLMRILYRTPAQSPFLDNRFFRPPELFGKSGVRAELVLRYYSVYTHLGT